MSGYLLGTNDWNFIKAIKKLAVNLKFYRAITVKFHADKISKIIKFQEIL